MNSLTLKDLKAVGQVNPDALIHADCLEAMLIKPWQVDAEQSQESVLTQLPIPL